MLVLFSLSSCYELQSDEELREDIIGTWSRTECKYPNNLEESGVDHVNPLRTNITFYSDGGFAEEGYYSFCVRDTCDSDTGVTDYCTCAWIIENGTVTIVPDANTDRGWLNLQFPVKCLRGDVLVFDNIMFNGEMRKKACFKRN